MLFGFFIFATILLRYHFTMSSPNVPCSFGKILFIDFICLVKRPKKALSYAKDPNLVYVLILATHLSDAYFQEEQPQSVCAVCEVR